MKLYRNHKRIKRNHNIGRVLVFGGLGVLVAGFLYSRSNTQDVNTVLLAAIVGTILSQYGLAVLRRWGRSPRDDELVDAALKGLNDSWSLFHYVGPMQHLLFGPPGALLLLPQHEEGTILHDTESGWMQERPPGGFLRRGGTRRLGRLASEADQARKDFDNFRRSRLQDEAVDAQPVLLFLSDQAQLHADPSSTPDPAIHYKKMKEWLRRQPKGRTPDGNVVRELASQFGLNEEGTSNS